MRINGDEILSIGCRYDPPKGGIAQVLYTYKNEVYDTFHFVKNSGNQGFLSNLWIALLGCIRMVYTIQTNPNIRVVHIHTASYISFRRTAVFVRLAKYMNRFVVLHIHGGAFRDYYQTNPNWISGILKKADCILALTDNWNSFFSDELHMPHVITVPNIVSNPQIKVIKNDNRIHLLFLGFIIEAKGIFDLAEVIKDHKAEWNGKLLLHVGGSHEVERLRRFVHENGLDTLIQYEGWVSGDKKIELLNQMDAYILPSYVEGLPISILESLAYGKPVITTPVGGIPEVVNENNGFLFSPGDRVTMYKIIQSIIDNPALLEKKACNAKIAVERNRPDNIARILDNVYKQLLVKEI